MNLDAPVSFVASSPLSNNSSSNDKIDSRSGHSTGATKLLDELLDSRHSKSCLVDLSPLDKASAPPSLEPSPSEDSRDQPSCSSASPNSVMIDVLKEQQSKVKPARRTRRGIDSPMKPIMTRNVYQSALQKSSAEVIPSNNTTINAKHNRQLSMDSTHSKVAAVARGTSKAAEETTETPEQILLDRPIACPKRQQTGGSQVSCVSEISLDSEMSFLPPRRHKLPLNRPAIRRPPRRDAAKGDVRSVIQRMKKSVLTPKQPQAADQPAPCPVRQLTLEKQTPTPAPNHTVVVTPKALLSKFDRQTSADTRDDDDDSGWSFDREEVYFQAAPQQQTSDMVKAWLSMPQTPPLPSSGQALVTPPMTPVQQQPTTTEDERTFGESSHHLSTPTQEEESTSANDSSYDNRMFQAYLKLPPRACTTPNVPVPLHPSKAVVLRTPQGARRGLLPRTIEGNLGCLDVSAIEVSIDLSLPSFFADCRGHMSDAIIPSLPKKSCDVNFTNKQGNIPSSANTTTDDAASVGSQTSLSLAELANNNKKDQRMSMPHQRKPTLLVDNSVEEQEAFWASMPIVLPSSPMNNHVAPKWGCSWPQIPASSSAPTIPNRFRRQDSLLPCEADDETMVRPMSPPRRSSMPPVMPHRRKPSLEVSLHSNDQKNCIDNQHLWSSLPILMGNDDEDDFKRTLPPSMPHRRKPSLEIQQDASGEEVCIELWLPDTTPSTPATSPASRRGGLQRSDSVPSIILKEGEMEI